MFISFLMGVALAAQPQVSLYADEGDAKNDAELTFAAVGNVCPSTLFGFGGPCPESVAILEHIKSKNVDFTALLGNLGANGNAKSWSSFVKLYQGSLGAMPALPVVGDSAYSGDKKLLNYAKTFPGVGQDIGLNRVAGWSHFNVTSNNVRWRFLVLDSNKKQMGSKWEEQLKWLNKTLSDKRQFDRLVVFLNSPLVDNGKEQKGAASELLDIVDTKTGFGQLRMVIAGKSQSTQAYLPNTKTGALHLMAGGGGLKTIDLRRAKPESEDDGSRIDDYTGEIDEFGALDTEGAAPEEDYNLLRGLDSFYYQQAKSSQLTPEQMDPINGTGKFKEKAPIFPGKTIPTHGWWHASIKGDMVLVSFFHHNAAGKMVDGPKMFYHSRDGWLLSP